MCVSISEGTQKNTPLFLPDVTCHEGRHVWLTLQIGRISNNGLSQWIKEEEGPQRQKKRKGKRKEVWICPVYVIIWCGVQDGITTNEMIKDKDWLGTHCVSGVILSVLHSMSHTCEWPEVRLPRQMQCSECCANRSGLCPTGMGERVPTKWALQLKKVPPPAVPLQRGMGWRRWDGRQRGELGNCFNNLDKWKWQGGGDAGENSEQEMGPWRPPAPQPRRGREERTGFYSLRRKETSLGKGMRSVWGASGKLRMRVCNLGQRWGWQKVGDRGEESKSSHDQSVLSTLMSPRRLLSLPTASHFHITAVNWRRDACQKRGTWRHMGAKCHRGPHTCYLYQLERNTHRNTHTHTHTHTRP